MVVSRKYLDAGAAISCGLGTLLVTTGLKPVPSAVSYLGAFAYAWYGLMVVGCFGAGVGALLRNRTTDNHGPAFHRRIWSIMLERICWPAIAVSAGVFGLGIAIRVGPLAGATTIGWSGFVILTCVGHWWVIRRARKGDVG